VERVNTASTCGVICPIAGAIQWECLLCIVTLA